MPSDKEQKKEEKKKNQMRAVDDLELLRTIIEQSPQLKERVLEKIFAVISPEGAKASGRNLKK